MNDKSDSQNELSRVLEKIQEIVKKSAGGDYIYRGEPEQYKEEPYDGKVSSNLYREYLDVEAEHFDITVVQKEILDKARDYIGEAVSDFEILTELQHRGGNTNLIDFTTDYLIALFFACDGSHDKPGRVILLEKESENYKIERASKAIGRAESQKSIFVQSDTGFIEPEQYKVIYIPSDLKTHILDYLQKHHDISTKTIYNDLQGFIENQRTHRSVYTEFYKGVSCGDKANSAKDPQEEQRWYEKAIIHYTEALELNPQMFEAYNNRGVAYDKGGKSDKALRDYNRALELDPDGAGGYKNRGFTYLSQDEPIKALQDFSKALELDSDDAAAYVGRGLAYLSQNEPDKALQDFSKVLELDPDNTGAYRGRGFTYLSQNEPDKALQDFSKVLELDPDDAGAYMGRGLAHQTQNEPDKALQDFSKVLELDSDDARAYMGRGRVYLAQGKPDEALQDYDRALELDPDDAGTYSNRGRVYLVQDEPTKAIQDFSKVIELDPDNAEVYDHRGRAYLIQDEPDKAVQDFNKVIELDSDNAKIYVRRGIAYHTAGEPDKAIQDFSRLIKLDPNDAEAYCCRGEVWLHLEEWEKAKADLTFAKENGYDIIASFHNDYENVEDFEQKNDVQLPEEIAAMLRRQ